MADIFNSQMYDGKWNTVISMNDLSDGTGLTLVKIIDVSLLNPDPGVHMVLWRTSYDVKGGDVLLYWEGTPNKLMMTMQSGIFERNFHRFGGLRNDATAATGSVLLSTVGFMPNSAFSITLDFKKGGITGFNV